MHTVRNQTRIQPAKVKRGPHQSRFPVLQGTHGIKKMRNARRPGLHGLATSLVTCAAMAKADMYSGFCEGPDLVGRNRFRCNRYHQAGQVKGSPQVKRKVILRHRPDQISVMSPLTPCK